jgi:thymidylate synthase (FAD)
MTPTKVTRIGLVYPALQLPNGQREPGNPIGLTGDRFIAYNAWLSTGKHKQAYTCDDEDIYKIIRFLIRGARQSRPARRPHATPFGHPHLTFLIEDMALYAAEQWLRHRTQNFSKDSFRYGALVLEQGDDDIFTLDISLPQIRERIYIPAPEDVRTQVGFPGDYTFPRLLDQEDGARKVEQGLAYIEDLCALSLKTYLKLLELGWAPELARGYLPTATLTDFTATASLRNWLNFLVLRATEPDFESQAQLEIRQPADDVEKLIAAEFPITYAAWNAVGRPVV